MFYVKMTLKRRCFLACFVFLVSVSVATSAVAAQSSSERKTYTLKNGLKVVLVENHKSPVVVFQIWYKVGSRMEHVGNTGLSHLLEHMMFKGTKKVPKGEFSKIVAKNGGNENAFTSNDYTAYFEKFSREHLNLSFQLESDRMQNIILDPKEFLMERDVVAEERRSRYVDDPNGALFEAVNSVAFKVHPYRNPTIGWMTDIQGLTREDLLEHYKKYYQPSNAEIVVVGDFDEAKAIGEIRKYFEKIPKGALIKNKKIVEPTQHGEKRVIVKKDAKLYKVYIAYHVPNYESKDSYSLDVLSQILFAGKSSRMYQEFVQKRKMVLSIDGGYSPTTAAPELFQFSATLHASTEVKAFESELYKQIDELKKELISTNELKKAKNQVEADFIFSQDSFFYQAMMIGRAESVGAGLEYLDNYVHNIRKVTAVDVKNVVKKYFSADNRTVGILTPTKPSP